MTALCCIHTLAPETDSDPQCPLLMQRIVELRAELSLEIEPARARHWRRQLRTVTERARRLGCFDPTRVRRSCDPMPP
jgi:hypothetical protein